MSEQDRQDPQDGRVVSDVLWGQAKRSGVAAVETLAGLTVNTASTGPSDCAASDVPHSAARRSGSITIPASALVVRAGRTHRTPIVVLTDSGASLEVTLEGTFGDLLAVAHEIIARVEDVAPEYRRPPDPNVVEARAILVEDVLRTLGVPQVGPDLEVTELGQADIRAARRLTQRTVDLLNMAAAR